MVLRDRSATQFSFQSAAPVVDILDERELAHGQTVDLRARRQRDPKGWQGVKRAIAAFLSDDMHLRQSPELVHDVAAAEQYIHETVLPAFEEVRAALVAQGRDVQVSDCVSCAILRISYGGRMEATVAARTRLTPTGVLPVFETRGCAGGQVRRALAAARLEDLVVTPVYAHEVRQEQVARFVHAAHQAVRVA